MLLNLLLIRCLQVFINYTFVFMQVDKIIEYKAAESQINTLLSRRLPCVDVPELIRIEENGNILLYNYIM